MNRNLIVIGVVILFLAVGLSGCEEQKNKGNIEMFIGVWEITEGSQPHFNTTWEFHSNGSSKIVNIRDSTHTDIIWNLWDIETGKLFLYRKPGSENGFYNISFDYYFSNVGATLTLKFFGNTQWVLNKID